jgi:hypothetical protein
VLFIVYAAGVAVAAVWTIGRFFVLKGIVRRATVVAKGDLDFRFVSLCRDMGLERIPRLRLSPEHMAPMVVGVVRPVVVMPSLLTSPAHEKGLTPAVAHEVAHVLRKDTWVNCFQVLLSVVWWFNPAVWILNRVVRQVREDCCDDVVVSNHNSSSRDYCNLLLHAASNLPVRRATGAPLGFAERLHPLAPRMQRIMDNTLRRGPVLRRWQGALVVVLALLLLPGLGWRKPPPPGETQPTEGQLVAYYPFDGDATDHSGHGLDATVNGATLAPDRFGAADSAYSFDGNDYIQVDHDDSLSGMSSLTVACWFKADTLPPMSDGTHPVSKANIGDGYMGSDCYHIGLSRTASGDVRISGGVTSGLAWSSDNEAHVSAIRPEVEFGEWHHVALTYDGDTLRLYLDGEEIDSEFFGKAPLNANAGVPLRVGRVVGGSTHNKYLDGAVDDVRIYNRALSIGEIRELAGISPAEQIAMILSFIESSIEDGTLVGDGRGRSADGRLGVLIHMIEAAGRLAEAEQYAEAHLLLLHAYARCDGETRPPDFVGGDAASELAQLIWDVMAILTSG